MKLMQIRWKFILAFLSLAAFLSWLAVLAFPDRKFHLIACDVGQGDSILASYGETQVLIDGGPDGGKVLECLGRHMPFWDKTIEVVLLTHQQKDHFRGLIDVFENYKVESFLATSLTSSSQEWEVLKNMVGGSGAGVINPVLGLEVEYNLIHLDILHPSEQFWVENASENLTENLLGSIDSQAKSSEKLNGGSGVLGAYTTSRDMNDFSLVVILSFKDFDALLTGDMGPGISDEVIKAIGESGNRSIEYIKIPHHGSKNGLTEELLRIAKPQLGIISVGKNNSYGHPHKEVIELLNKENVRVLRTDEMGDVEVVSDGKTFWLK